MEFGFTEEQLMIRDVARRIAQEKIAPSAEHFDRTGEFPLDNMRMLGENGLMGIEVPAEYGGAGMDYISLGIISEELEYIDTSLRVIMSVHAGLNCLTLLSWGTEDQKQRYLVPQAKGEKIATYGLTEPAAGSDARGIQTVAVKRGDRWVLTGEKMWISLADVADNFLVFAWTDLEKKKQKDPSGISAFILDMSSPGVTVRPLRELTGTSDFRGVQTRVGEVMAIGRTFRESLQKALRGLEIGRAGLADGWRPGVVHAHDWQAGLVPAYVTYNAPTRVKTTSLSVARQFAVHGFEHIITGYDHLLFVAAPFLLSRRSMRPQERLHCVEHPVHRRLPRQREMARTVERHHARAVARRGDLHPFLDRHALVVPRMDDQGRRAHFGKAVPDVDVGECLQKADRVLGAGGLPLKLVEPV